MPATGPTWLCCCQGCEILQDTFDWRSGPDPGVSWEIMYPDPVTTPDQWWIASSSRPIVPADGALYQADIITGVGTPEALIRCKIPSDTKAQMVGFKAIDINLVTPGGDPEVLQASPSEYRGWICMTKDGRNGLVGVWKTGLLSTDKPTLEAWSVSGGVWTLLGSQEFNATKDPDDIQYGGSFVVMYDGIKTLCVSAYFYTPTDGIPVTLVVEAEVGWGSPWYSAIQNGTTNWIEVDEFNFLRTYNRNRDCSRCLCECDDGDKKWRQLPLKLYLTWEWLDGPYAGSSGDVELTYAENGCGFLLDGWTGIGTSPGGTPDYRFALVCTGTSSPVEEHFVLSCNAIANGCVGGIYTLPFPSPPGFVGVINPDTVDCKPIFMEWWAQVPTDLGPPIIYSTLYWTVRE